jgi:hypothetical protein
VVRAIGLFGVEVEILSMQFKSETSARNCLPSKIRHVPVNIQYDPDGPKLTLSPRISITGISPEFCAYPAVKATRFSPIQCETAPLTQKPGRSRAFAKHAIDDGTQAEAGAFSSRRSA